MIAFLLSTMRATSTGAVIPVDGGYPRALSARGHGTAGGLEPLIRVELFDDRNPETSAS